MYHKVLVIGLVLSSDDLLTAVSVRLHVRHKSCEQEEAGGVITARVGQDWGW